MPPIKSGQTIDTTDPKIDITPTADAPLPAGSYRFGLVVEDDQGRKSPEVFVTVVVQKTLPDAVLKGPDKVELNTTFSLDATGFAAVAPAKLAKFHWRLAPRFTDLPGPIGPIGPITPGNPNT
jgi:hypothetical protein